MGAQRRVEPAWISSSPTPAAAGGPAPLEYAQDRYEVSQAIGDCALLPRVRDAGEDTLLVANGFTCRERIRQNTGRVPLDLAQVLQMRLRRSSDPG